MLPSSAPIPQGKHWVFGVKWDGIRLLADIAQGQVRLRTRPGRDVTADFPELHRLGDALGRDALLDAELVVLTANGRPDFDRVRRRLVTSEPDRRSDAGVLCLVLFDVLALDGHLLVDLPYRVRRRHLEDLDLSGPHWHTPPLWSDGQALLDATFDLGLEGVVAKHLDSPYRPVRTRWWRKTKHRMRSTLHVGGWTARPDGGVAELLVGHRRRDGGLIYTGRVELGLTLPHRLALAPHLDALTCPNSPFGFRLRGGRWLHPELQVLVDHSMPTPAGRLREALFAGLPNPHVILPSAGVRGAGAAPLPLAR